MSDGRFAGILQDFRDRIAASGTGGRRPPIEPPRPRDDDDGMEARVRRLEEDVRAIRSDLTTIHGRLSGVEGELKGLSGQVSLLAGQVAGLSTQVANKIPGTWQQLSLIVGTFVALVSLSLAAAKAAQWLEIIPG